MVERPLAPVYVLTSVVTLLHKYITISMRLRQIRLSFNISGIAFYNVGNILQGNRSYVARCV